ncbi:FAD-binding protein [Rhodobacteraceae bacterium 2CG4]|uniref:FAD-binding protein n=1 Tax=Halovulum marinum TaxID=2662447 RepID=A0A6L5Z623_9RHOB|nr:FAD-binding oxidoreductase [Halovulum marinum]MSU91495.1 FAD-binding protein [Halovulum marinum]
MPLTAATPEIVEALSAVLPEGRVGAVPPAYAEDPRGRALGTAIALVRPVSTREVAEVVRFAARNRVGLVPIGGGTGLVRGQIPDGPAPLLLSLERMNSVPAADPVDNVLVAEAGAILAEVQAAAEAVGRLFPLSLASEGSARIGGLLSTNAGGVNVLRYGNARELVLGIEAVLPDGSILDGPKRLRKDNTGYDLRNLLIGAEGTLGVITAASLRLFPRPAEEATALLAVRDPAAALELLGRLRDTMGEAVNAFELIARTSFDFLAEVLPEVPQPFAARPDWAVLVEAGGARGTQVAERLEAALADAFERELIHDALIAQNRQQAADFWGVREHIPEANKRIGAVASHDIALPVAQVPAFIAEAGAALHGIDARFRINCFGHLGDGNLHYNVFPAQAGGRDAHEHQRAAVTDCVHELVHRYHGSFSAEHGVGRLKVAELERYGGAAKLAAMRAIKTALDPHGIMNPGAVLRAE